MVINVMSVIRLLYTHVIYCAIQLFVILISIISTKYYSDNYELLGKRDSSSGEVYVRLHDPRLRGKDGGENVGGVDVRGMLGGTLCGGRRIGVGRVGGDLAHGAVSVVEQLARVVVVVELGVRSARPAVVGSGVGEVAVVVVAVVVVVAADGGGGLPGGRKGCRPASVRLKLEPNDL